MSIMALHFHGQAEQVDEALGIRLVVHVVLAERGEVFAVQAERRLAPHRRAGALVELHADRAGHLFLRLGYDSVQGLTQRREPLPEVDELCVAVGDLLLVVQRLAVQHQALQLVVGGVQDRAARRLVHAARLHAHQAVLHHVGAADAVDAAQLVQPRHQLDGAAGHAVDALRDALLEVDLHVLRLVGSLLRRAGQHEHVLVRLVPRIFQDAALVADVPDVAVAAVDRALA